MWFCLFVYLFVFWGEGCNLTSGKPKAGLLFGGVRGFFSMMVFFFK